MFGSSRRPINDRDLDDPAVNLPPPSQFIQEDEDEEEDGVEKEEDVAADDLSDFFVSSPSHDRASAEQQEPNLNSIRGSDWIKKIGGGQEPALGAGDQVIDDSKETRPGSGGKKRKRRNSGLVEKLHKILKQHESDEALRQHVRARGLNEEFEEAEKSMGSSSTCPSGDADLVDLELNIVDLTPFRNDLLWRVARCLEVEDSQSEFDLLLQTTLLGRAMVEQMDVGAEIKIRAPYFVKNSDSVPLIYGVNRLEIQDQPILPSFAKLRKSKLLMTWACDCENENP